MPKVERKCKLCQKSFTVERWQLKNNKCIYCSHKCANEANKSFRIQANFGRIPWNKGLHVHLNPNAEWKKGNIPWNKGIKTGKNPAIGLKLKGRRMSPATEFKKGGHYYPKNEFKKGQSYTSLHRGELHPNWKGGITPIRTKIWRSPEYKKWRESVFERDNYTCQECDAKNGEGKTVYFEAHHIKSFADYPELIFEVGNGITLCLDCHNKTKRGRPKLCEGF